MSKKQAAAYLDISMSFPSKKHYRVGKKVLLRKSEIDDWMQQFVQEPQAAREIVDDVVAASLEGKDLSHLWAIRADVPNVRTILEYGT